MQSEGAIVVDTRPAMQFAVAHVPGALHVALTGQYASWAARILGLDSRLIISGEDDDHVAESQMRLAPMISCLACLALASCASTGSGDASC